MDMSLSKLLEMMKDSLLGEGKLGKLQSMELQSDTT